MVLVSIDKYQTNEEEYLWSPFNKIAVLEINGPISSEKNSSDFLFGGVRTGSSILLYGKQLSKDPFLQGVIFMINSPGGSVIASDQILNAVNDFKLAAKPVLCIDGYLSCIGWLLCCIGLR